MRDFFKDYQNRAKNKKLPTVTTFEGTQFQEPSFRENSNFVSYTQGIVMKIYQKT
jgi:hypothetical protein